jgi:hypothetical protein
VLNVSVTAGVLPEGQTQESLASQICQHIVGQFFYIAGGICLDLAVKIVCYLERKTSHIFVKILFMSMRDADHIHGSLWVLIVFQVVTALETLPYP